MVYEEDPTLQYVFCYHFINVLSRKPQLHRDFDVLGRSMKLDIERFPLINFQFCFAFAVCNLLQLLLIKPDICTVLVVDENKISILSGSTPMK